MATVLTLNAVDRSTYIITATFQDEDETPVTPDSLSWTLTNGLGGIVNNRENVVVVSPQETETFILSGDDLAFADGKFRRFIIEATYSSTLGTGLPLRAQANFSVEDLEDENT